MLGLTQSIDANGNVTTEWEFGLYTYTAASRSHPDHGVLLEQRGPVVNFSAAGKRFVSSTWAGDSLTRRQITATQNDYNPTGLSTAKTVLLSCDQARSITGFGRRMGHARAVDHQRQHERRRRPHLPRRERRPRRPTGSVDNDIATDVVLLEPGRAPRHQQHLRCRTCATGAIGAAGTCRCCPAARRAGGCLANHRRYGSSGTTTNSGAYCRTYPTPS